MPPKSPEALLHKKEHNRQWLMNHPESVKRYDQKRRLKAKMEALTHYGNGKCACVQCGENRLACLSLDHINGGGAEERRQNSAKIGTNFYGWLRHRNYPTGYQTLCMNCQYIKRYTNGECGGASQKPTSVSEQSNALS